MSVMRSTALHIVLSWSTFPRANSFGYIPELNSFSILFVIIYVLKNGMQLPNWRFKSLADRSKMVLTTFSA
jgi:hypothetical protein